MKAVELPEYYNAASLLEQNIKRHPGKTALYSAARCLTFEAVTLEANQVGNGLQALGVGFGDRVGLIAPDSAEWVTTFFGIIKLGAIAASLNTEMQPNEYDTIFKDSRLRVLIVHESLLDRIELVRDRHPHLEQVIVIGQPRRTRDHAFHEWLLGQSSQLISAPTHRDDPCSLHYTSGSTGQPKGMFHAHKDYPLIAHNSGVELFGIGEQDRTFSVSKLYFVYGLGANLVMPWSVGASIVLDPSTTGIGHKPLETMAQFRPTLLFSVPSAYRSMLAVTDQAQRYDLSSLRLCISAGEALSAALWQQWKTATSLEILDTIGCTETFHTFMANRPGDLRPGSSGKPSPGYEVKLVEDDGTETPLGEIGNLLVKGETIVLDYLHHYTLSKQTFQGPWLRTGDKYYQDAGGFYWHAGRADDLFKVGGLWVSPIEVEGVLNNHPAVHECAVVASRKADTSAKPKAFIRLAEHHQPSTALIKVLLQHCAGQFAAYKCPAQFEFVSELPKTTTGKVQRYKLRGEQGTTQSNAVSLEVEDFAWGTFRENSYPET